MEVQKFYGQIAVEGGTQDNHAVTKKQLDDATAYDLVIRTQAQFEEMIDSQTWLGATSVALIGQFTLSTTDNIGVKIPSTVKQIHGFNSAKITITNFKHDSSTAKGGLWYDEAPTTPDYSIRDLEVDCTGAESWQGRGFMNCTNLTNCKGTGTGTFGYGFHTCTNLTNCIGTGTSTTTGDGYGFHTCTNLTNCTGTGTGTNGYGYGFYRITTASNCKDGGSTTAMWGGTNRNINLETCRKTLIDAENATLNA